MIPALGSATRIGVFQVRSVPLPEGLQPAQAEGLSVAEKH